MIAPTFRYHDDGGITLTFDRSPIAWATASSAEAWLRDRGFSIGTMQGADPRGILHGHIRICKWRNLRPIEREALHGIMTGDGRNGPLEVEIYARAPVAVRMAAVSTPERHDDAKAVASDRVVDAGFIGIVFALACVGYAALAPVFAPPRHPSIGKIELRAGPLDVPAMHREARR